VVALGDSPTDGNIAPSTRSAAGPTGERVTLWLATVGRIGLMKDGLGGNRILHGRCRGRRPRACALFRNAASMGGKPAVSFRPARPG